MRTLILLAATAALTLPSAAMAERHQHHGDRDRNESHYDRHGDRDHHRDQGRSYRSYHQDRDWHGDRHHRHHGSYVAPYRNWHYRRVGVGYRLRPVFYSPRYYINDYGYYHVHAPRPWERWIRYGDDLLLVDIRNGRVIDVIPYRYW